MECQGAHPAVADVYILAMIFRPRRSGANRKALALLVLVIHGASVGAAEPERIFLRFEVLGGPAAGLHFLTLTATVDQSHQGYAIAAEAKTRGLADLFLALHSRLDVRGRISDGVLFPEAMHAETHRRGLDLYTRLDYGVDGTVTAETRPPVSWPAVPVTAAQMRGTWLARLLPADLMVPVRMEFASEFGTFTADLVELRGGGQYFRFLE